MAWASSAWCCSAHRREAHSLGTAIDNVVTATRCAGMGRCRCRGHTRVAAGPPADPVTDVLLRDANHELPTGHLHDPFHLWRAAATPYSLPHWERSFILLLIHVVPFRRAVGKFFRRRFSTLRRLLHEWPVRFFRSAYPAIDPQSGCGAVPKADPVAGDSDRHYLRKGFQYLYDSIPSQEPVQLGGRTAGDERHPELASRSMSRN